MDGIAWSPVGGMESIDAGERFSEPNCKVLGVRN
jgi:hypothetical protein